MDYELLIGDCRETLRDLEPQSVHCVVTSPPYFNLRTYGEDEKEIGIEQTADEYIENMVGVFKELWRVLRDDGTVWLNIGDTYQDKQQLGIPWRLAFALRDAGWLVRQDIIWAKPNCMPEPAKDRCVRSHEHIFLLTKKPEYYFDHVAIKTPGKWSERDAQRANNYQEELKKAEERGTSILLQKSATPGDERGHSGIVGIPVGNPNRGANKRDVWLIGPSTGYNSPHFAVYPPDLIEPCILAGTSAHGCCSNCGTQYVRDIEQPELLKVDDSSCDRYGTGKAGVHRKIGQNYNSWRDANPNITVGWKANCECNSDIVPSVVLDPFGGSGTTAGVAIKYGRKAILCELHEQYTELIPDRIRSIAEIATVENDAEWL